jgi:hypothetical protein
MEIQLDINKIPNPRVVTVFILSFTILIAPFWFIYQFAPIIYKNNSLIQLLLLSISIGFPLLLLNFLAITLNIRYLKKGNLIYYGIKIKNENKILVNANQAALVTIFHLYFPLILTFRWHVTMEFAVNSVAIIEVAFLIVQLIFKIANTIANWGKEIEDNDSAAEGD